jgi:hypothetical protein
MLDHDSLGRSDPSFVDGLQFLARFELRLRCERSFRANPSLPSRYAVFDPGSRHGEVNNPTLDSRAAPEGFGSREVSFARPGNISSTMHQTLAAETISTHIGGLRTPVGRVSPAMFQSRPTSLTRLLETQECGGEIRQPRERSRCGSAIDT